MQLTFCFRLRQGNCELGETKQGKLWGMWVFTSASCGWFEMARVAWVRASLHTSFKGGFCLNKTSRISMGDRVPRNQSREYPIFPPRTSWLSLISYVDSDGGNQRRAPRTHHIGAYRGTISGILIVILRRFITILHLADPWCQPFLHVCREPLRANFYLFKRYPKHVT